MVKLFFIKCCNESACGFVGDQSVLKHDGFKVRYIAEDSIHEKDNGLVLFFSRGQATVVRDKIMEIATDRKPGHTATMDIVSDTFDQDIADALLIQKWKFKDDVDDQDED